MGCSPLGWSYTRSTTDGDCLEAIGYEWIQECWKQDGEEGIEHRESYERIWSEWVGKYVSFLEDVQKMCLVE
jgi:hypothetical protein